ncbi:haloacetate dehalogenase [Kibdelosporangium banguiense]|uniref:Haloacetate dehalogenase n=1 Tax=Kibdelosporangium banguiense TaxID=1365924 RepID=A0ABS4TZJ3_9PSEU|nr:alpha/beta hydrolase [Kibdelosporangium banguiense]MBP2329833.1 haloacetate dehalogenase [Kibdelosporangium banguiense]
MNLPPPIPGFATGRHGVVGDMGFFPGFTLDLVDVPGVRLRVRHGGTGTPVVLVHGHPRTHTTWYQVAPMLAEDHFVVCPDLRGYGQSGKPPSTDDHSPYSKRAMAADIVELMRELGHETFAIVGHDRGACVAYRAALDHPSVITKLVVMDGVPVVEALDRCDATFAQMWWHWFFFGQLAKPAERVISADPETWYNAWTSNGPDWLGTQNHADFLAAIRDPATVHAMIEDYRAGLDVDRQHDEADREAGRQITCPTMMLWALRDDMEELYGDPLEIWEPWCPQITGHGIDAGHHIAEQAPKQLAQDLRDFLD